ncbi:MAG: ABC transporter ATP-binding protein [Hyphomonadaceae bacterium]|nr:ABC transporter ATP-binding protein [Hyphomonadaceae bacterium]
MSARGAVLRIDNVTLQFGGIAAIKSVAFEAQPSELLALVGPNGAGKTAMLNCISGIYRPTSGDILLDGKSIIGQPLHRMVRLGIGRAFQHAELFPHLTVTENLLIGRHTKFRRGLWASGLYIGSTRRDEMNERRHVEGIIDFFEIYRHRDAPVGSLPYGVQKIVGVARALATGPKLLLLDEPCTGLIREERENLARFLLRIRHEFAATIIWVEHDMQMVSDLADRVVVLNHGIKIVDGLPDDVRRSAAVIEAYLGHTAAGAVADRR